jgi:hypothetical protein
LELKIFDTQTTFGFWSLDVFPCHKALGAVASLLTCPKEGPTPAINRFDDGFWNGDGRHEVEGKGAENGGTEGETPSSIKQGSAPLGEVFVTRRKEREAVVDRDFVGGKRKTKVGLGEGRDGSAEGNSKLMSMLIFHSNRKEGSLVVVDRKAGCRFKELENTLSSIDRFNVALNKNQGVIGVLKDGAGKVSHQGVSKRGS